MNEPRYETKVGAFVLMGLILLAVLIILLSKGTAFWTPTYNLNLQSGNVGGIKVFANILLSGVPVGRVARVKLSEDGTNVIIVLNILQKYRIHNDAIFSIEQSGFLGDQYVSIRPVGNQGPLLKDGDEVECAKPFDMQEAIAHATETISRIGQTATNLNQAVSDVREYVLNEDKLKSIAATLDRVSAFAGQALDAVSNVNALVEANAGPVSGAVSNLNYVTYELGPAAGHLSQIVSNNEPTVTAAINNLYSTSVSLTNLMNDLESQKGLAGHLLRDQQIAENFSELSRNLASISATLDQRGIWGLMWRHKPVATNSAASSGNH